MTQIYILQFCIYSEKSTSNDEIHHPLSNPSDHECIHNMGDIESCRQV